MHRLLLLRVFLTDDDLHRLLLGVPARSFVTDTRTPEQEAERGGVGGVVEVHLLGFHLAVVDDPYLQPANKQQGPSRKNYPKNMDVQKWEDVGFG